jgi:hypothetical protein
MPTQSLSKQPVSKLKTLALYKGISIQGCLEKDDIIAALRAGGVTDNDIVGPAATSSSPAAPSATPARSSGTGTGYRVQLAVSLLGGVPGVYSWHSSVLVDGEEFAFSDAGVSRSRGLVTHANIALQEDLEQEPSILDIGVSPHSGMDLYFTLNKHFPAGTYDLLRKNCNTFSDACLFFLVQKRLDGKYSVLDKVGVDNLDMVQAVSGKAYVPNSQAADFDLEKLISALDPDTARRTPGHVSQAWQIPGQASSSRTDASTDTSRKQPLARFEDGGYRAHRCSRESAGDAPRRDVRQIFADEEYARMLVSDTHQQNLDLAQLFDEEYAASLEEDRANCPGGSQRASRSSSSHSPIDPTIGTGESPASPSGGGILQGVSGFLSGLASASRNMQHMQPNRSNGYARDGTGCNATSRGRQEAASSSTVFGSTVLVTAEDVQTRRAPSADSSGGDDSAQRQCMICFESFSSGEQLRILPCLHKYHAACIDSWLGRSSLCPICKHDIRS